ncbi:uncharacterized protein [Drosophila bipectinata]|uniref:uncharacterized protein n=1 Tax=Drosophila bipectinata TaxID=42026 RepID=UPI0038B39023
MGIDDEKTGTQANPSPSDQFAGLHARQKDLWKRLTQLERNFKKDSQSRKSKHYFLQLLSTLKDLSTLFDANHQQLVDQLCPSEHVYFSDNLYERFVEEHQHIFCNISEEYDNKFSVIAQGSPPIESVTPILSSNIPLPKLPVPRFSGSFTDWPSFYDGFLQLIHDNNTLSNIQKFHSLSPGQSSHPRAPNRSNFNSTNRHSFHVTTEMGAPQCTLCQRNHVLRRCPSFLAKDCFARKTIVDRIKACLNCLSTGHALSHCGSTHNCLQCGQRHHTLLHFPNIATQPTNSALSRQPTNGVHSAQGTQQSVASRSSVLSQQHSLAPGLTASNETQLLSAVATYQNPSTTILTTALIRIVNDQTGQSVLARALIDHGSEGTLITESLVQTLGLSRTPISAEITGIGDSSHNRCRHSTNFVLSSISGSQFTSFVSTAFILRTLTGHLPKSDVDPRSFQHLKGLQLADPNFARSGRIDVLVGVDLIPQLMLPEIRRGTHEKPIAQNTLLGWIVFGPVRKSMTHSITVRCNTTTLDHLVQMFFELDSEPSERQLTTEERWCEEHFRQTHVRQPNEKYMVRLPLKTLFDPSQVLDRSKHIALNRFYTLERKLQQRDKLHQQYLQAIEEYFDLQQIQEVTTSEDSHSHINTNGKLGVFCSTIPHHAVLKENSLTTKLRVVYDASCKSSNGKSLNDMMYRCIEMHPEDSQFQRIWWRDKTGELKEFRLTTVTFGTASAPYTAIRVIHQIAQDERENYPLAEKVLKREIYVDDVQSGHETTDGAIRVRNEVIAALRSAGMHLRKWAANHPALLSDIPKVDLCNHSIFEMDNKDSIKTLGLYWQPNPDVFGFKIHFSINPTLSKRALLSTVARLFDPLGFLAPLTVMSKILLKDVWSFRMQQTDGTYRALDWDDMLPESLAVRWQRYLEHLPEVQHIRIPRWFGCDFSNVISLQLHMFSDGSSLAYAACAYLRVLDTAGIIHTHLVAARTRVTPKKPLTIPRVELSGAVLATKLATWIQQQLHVPQMRVTVYYWSDAMIVLHWIYGDPCRWKTFVANRIGSIQEVSSASQWGHVSTQDNPADCATRGLTPLQLAQDKLWWSGPDWLQEPEDHWPKVTLTSPDPSTICEEQAAKVIHAHTCASTDSFVESFSSYSRLVFSTAFINRFIHNTRCKREARLSGPIGVKEFSKAMYTLVRVVQQEAFSHELSKLRANKSLSKSNKLSQLSPFIDAQRILRVRGRLRNALQLTTQQRTPIILPKSHHFTDLVLKNAHLNTMHGGVQLTRAIIHQQFWIINGKQAVKGVLRQCVACFQHRPKPSRQLMGDLPYHRVNPPKRAFEATGVDYTGSIDVKASSKAIHLELVTGLTAQHFLWALQRFIGRRGFVRHMFSDCGTNFIAADKSLQLWSNEFRQEINQTVVPELTKRYIQWHFNPPHSPNFGGLWEANVKAIKACLNSRPLCPLTADINDLQVLTPAHFLIGDSMQSLPTPSDKDKSLNTQFMERQRILRQFWKRWSSDWLSHLQARPKWRQEEENLQVNDLVIIKDDRTGPTDWKLGRVIELHPGADGLVRVATIYTGSGTYKRSVSKICRLPIPNYTETKVEEANLEQ